MVITRERVFLLNLFDQRGLGPLNIHLFRPCTELLKFIVILSSKNYPYSEDIYVLGRFIAFLPFNFSNGTNSSRPRNEIIKVRTFLSYFCFKLNV